MEVSRRNCEGKWTPGIIRVDLHVESFVRALANLKRRAEFRFPSFVLIADLMRPSIPPTLFPPPFDAPCHVQFLPYLRVEQECWPFHGKALDISSIIRFPPHRRNPSNDKDTGIVHRSAREEESYEIRICDDSGKELDTPRPNFRSSNPILGNTRKMFLLSFFFFSFFFFSSSRKKIDL